MKKALLFGLMLATALTVASRPQARPQAVSDRPASQVEDGTLRDIQGTVKAEGNKLKFVTDQDGATWNVINPEVLKGHLGQHVELNVHLYPSKGSIHVHTVKKPKNEGMILPQTNVGKPLLHGS